MYHEMNIINREKIVVTAVTSVDEFDENCISVNLEENQLVIYGTNLRIAGLDMEEGVLTAAGRVDSVAYVRKKEKKSLCRRLLR